MMAFVGSYALSVVVVLILYILLGLQIKKRWNWILIDERGRYSLNRLQLAVWTAIILPNVLIVAITDSSIGIPEEILWLMGISVGTFTISTAVKTHKDETVPGNIARPCTPSFWDMFLEEEGAGAVNKTISIGKFQSFLISLMLWGTYIYLVSRMESADFPEFTPTLILLIGISHSGYVAHKAIPRPKMDVNEAIRLREIEEETVRKALEEKNRNEPLVVDTE